MQAVFWRPSAAGAIIERMAGSTALPLCLLPLAAVGAPTPTISKAQEMSRLAVGAGELALLSAPYDSVLLNVPGDWSLAQQLAQAAAIR